MVAYEEFCKRKEENSREAIFMILDREFRLRPFFIIWSVYGLETIWLVSSSWPSFIIQYFGSFSLQSLTGIRYVKTFLRWVRTSAISSKSSMTKSDTKGRLRDKVTVGSRTDTAEWDCFVTPTRRTGFFRAKDEKNSISYCLDLLLKCFAFDIIAAVFQFIWNNFISCQLKQFPNILYIPILLEQLSFRHFLTTESLVYSWSI